MGTLLEVLLILGLVFLNAFFVAAEYALLSVRRTRLEQLARDGEARARVVQALLSDVGLLFSGIQLGITVASLLMGAIGESIMSHAIMGVLEEYLARIAALTVAHSIAVACGFLLITTLLMWLGRYERPLPRVNEYDQLLAAEVER